MDLNTALIWMFIGSMIIGIYFHSMNALADDCSHIYFSSTTMIYSALLMASLMCVLEVLMHSSHSSELNLTYLIVFLVLSVLMVTLLREQTLVDDRQWLKEMITHHSTAITTSKKISEKTKNKNVKKLATSIIRDQTREIRIMQDMLRKIQ